MDINKKYAYIKNNPKGLSLQYKHLLPRYDSDTIIIKPLVLGICRSDIKELEGTRTTRHDFGHEFVGEVIWTNAKTSLKKGDNVVFDPHVNIDRGTGFAEFIIAKGDPAALEHAFINIKPDTNYKRMVFTEPMSCANHCVSRMRIYLGKRSLKGISLAILGAGNAGALIGLIAKYYGAKVTLFNRTQDRLEFLQKNNIFKNSELNTLNHNSASLYDVVVPATSFLFPEVMSKAARIVKKEGLLLLFGGTNLHDVLPESTYDIDLIRRMEQIDRINYKGKDFRIAGTYGARTQDFQEVISLLENEADSFPVERLITKEITLAEVPEVLSSVKGLSYQGKFIVNLS